MNEPRLPEQTPELIVQTDPTATPEHGSRFKPNHQASHLDELLAPATAGAGRIAAARAEGQAPAELDIETQAQYEMEA